MEAALGFHHCTNMGAEFEFQPRGLIGGGVFRGMSFYRFCECVCVCVFKPSFLLLLALNSSIYILFYVMSYVCHVLYITKSKSLCSRENEFEIESFGDFFVYKF